jgi:hypothetical protein
MDQVRNFDEGLTRRWAAAAVSSADADRSRPLPEGPKGLHTLSTRSEELAAWRRAILNARSPDSCDEGVIARFELAPDDLGSPPS